MLVNLAQHKSILDAMFGFKDTVTDHTTGGVLRFLDYKHDNANYENNYQKIINKK